LIAVSEILKIKYAGKLFVFAISLLLFQTIDVASQTTKEEKWATKLQLIDSVKQYITSKTGMKIREDFYTEWQPENKWYHYLYVSLPDKIERKPKTPAFYYFGNDHEVALKKKKKFDRKGYHTFIYKTAGTSGTRITERLLSYSNEAIVFILFHEAFHHHTSIDSCTEPYSFNESTGDVLGNYLALEFYSNNETFKEKSLTQITNNELIYSAMNETSEKINAGKNVSVSDYETCKKIIDSALTTCNDFQKDRFDYEINNAYFLKNRYYSEHYFLLKELYLKLSDSAEFLKTVCALPNNEAEAVNTIKELLKK
jgi:hypothetical protein